MYHLLVSPAPYLLSQMFILEDAGWVLSSDIVGAELPSLISSSGRVRNLGTPTHLGSWCQQLPVSALLAHIITHQLVEVAWREAAGMDAGAGKR